MSLGEDKEICKIQGNFRISALNNVFQSEKSQIFTQQYILPKKRTFKHSKILKHFQMCLSIENQQGPFYVVNWRLLDHHYRC